VGGDDLGGELRGDVSGPTHGSGGVLGTVGSDEDTFDGHWKSSS
jgi:hypothetical protein